jgi:O-antigen/teichoic acid export membrane protein
VAETGRLAVRGSLFVAISNYLMQAISIAFSVVLTRLLTPDDFGVLALATVVYSVIARVRVLGLNELLVARPDPSDQVVGTHLMLSTGLSVAAMLLTFAVSPILARFYTPQVIGVLQVLSVLHVFDDTGIAATPSALLRKDLRFARLSTVDVAATAVSLLAGIGAALSGAGVWALVIRDGAGIAIRSLGMWILVPRRPKLAFDAETAKELLKQGSHMWVSGTSTYVVASYDDFLVGNLLGTIPLGFYSRAYRYAKLPMSPLAPLYSVLAPTYARLRDDRARLSRTYTLFLEALSLTAFPAAVMMAVAAPELVTIVLTEKWTGVAPLLRWLLPYALLRPIMDGSYSMAVAVGAPEVVSRIGAIEAALMLVLCTALTWAFGAPGAAISAALVVLAGLTLFYRRFLRERLQVSFVRIFGPPCLALLAAAVASLALAHAAGTDNTVIRLVVKLGAGGTVFAAILVPLRGQHVLNQLRYIYRVGTAERN